MTELLGRVPTIPTIPNYTNFQWHTKILTCFQFNSSVYSDDCSYGLDLEHEGQKALEHEGQAHQKY